ncbi:MAG TPA: hypothetical protein VH413_02720 [Verrucomicrobiae bacterium]|jgi:hypothetical protein|nr:hypothetical protein [Verrucomicrobiae bacterium]
MRKFFALSAAVLYFASHAGATVLPAEKMLPDDTLMLFTLPDFTKVRDIYNNSPQGRLWNDPAMKDFKDKFMSKLNSDYITPLEHDLGITFSDYTNLPQGQITLAMVQNGTPGKEGWVPAFLFLMDTKDKSSQLKTNLADLKKKWVDAGKTIKTETIREVDFSAITLSSADIPKTLKKPDAPLPPGVPPPMENTDLKKAPKEPIYIGQAESLLIIGNSTKVIEKLLARMAGDSVKTVSELSTFDANAGMFHDAPAFGWVNVKAFVDIWNHPSDDAADANSPNPFALKPDKVLPALGLTGVNTLAFNYLSLDDGAHFNLTLSAPESTRTGLIKILAGEAKEYNPPPFVPADVVKFQRWRLDGSKTWTELRKIVMQVSPSAIGGIDFVLGSAESAAKEKDPSFDLKKNLFGNLGDDFISYSKDPRGKSEPELNSPPSLFLIGSPDPELLSSTVKTLVTLSGQQGGPITDREFLGHKIYSIPLPSAPGPGGTAPTARALSYASSGGYLAVTLDPPMIEEYLRSSQDQGKALRDIPGLADATQKVGGSGTSLFGYSNDAETMRVFFDILKQNPSTDPLGGAAPVAAAVGMGGLKTSEWFDPSLLPTFDKIAKYFYFSVYSAGATADGITFKGFAPTPPQYKN